MENAKEKILKEIIRSQGNMTFDNMAYSTGLSFIELSSMIGLLYKEKRIGLYAIPIIEKDCRYKTRAEELFGRFMNLLSEHFTQERKVTFYASELCVTPKYLATTIKQASGKTPTTWINEMVFMEMERELRYSQLSIKEIAYELHFPNTSFFGKFFKARSGMSPLRYRQLFVENRNEIHTQAIVQNKIVEAETTAKDFADFDFDKQVKAVRVRFR